MERLHDFFLKRLGIFCVERLRDFFTTHSLTHSLDTLKVTFLKTYADGPTDGQTDGRTDGQTTGLLELLRAAKKNTHQKLEGCLLRGSSWSKFELFNWIKGFFVLFLTKKFHHTKTSFLSHKKNFFFCYNFFPLKFFFCILSQRFFSVTDSQLDFESCSGHNLFIYQARGV